MADDVVPGVDETESDTQESYNDVLNDDSVDDVDVEETETEEDGEVEEVSEEKEEEVPEEKEEKEEIQARSGVPIKRIQKDYPDLFKRYPDLKHVLFRDKELQNIFPTVEDAKTAMNDAEFLAEIDRSLEGGNPKGLLAALGKNPELINGFAEKIIPALKELDSNLYLKAIAPEFQGQLRRAFIAGSKSKDANLEKAARILHNFFFESYDIPASVERKEDPELARRKAELDNRERQMFEDRKQEFDGELNKKTNKELERIAAIGLDPENKMTVGMKKAAINQIIDELGDLLERDPAHNSSLRGLYKRAEKSNFSRIHITQILNAYLGRAQNRIGSVRAKVRAEFLGGNGKSAKVDKQLPTSAPSGNSRGSVKDDKKLNYRDFLSK